jgi:hypothetical protein
MSATAWIILIDDGGNVPRYFTRVGEPPSKFPADAFRFPSYAAASEYLRQAGRSATGSVSVTEVPA